MSNLPEDIKLPEDTDKLKQLFEIAIMKATRELPVDTVQMDKLLTCIIKWQEVTNNKHFKLEELKLKLAELKIRDEELKIMDRLEKINEELNAKKPS